MQWPVREWTVCDRCGQVRVCRVYEAIGNGPVFICITCIIKVQNR